MTQNQKVGIVCTFAAIGLIAWLSVQSWGNAECREVLEESKGEAGTAKIEMANVIACRDRLGEEVEIRN